MWFCFIGDPVVHFALVLNFENTFFSGLVGQERV